MGTVVAVLLVGSVAFCFIRRCWKSKKSVRELNEKAETVTLPTVARQDSFDSGAYTASDPNSSNDSRPIPPSRPVDTHSVQLSTHTESSTVPSVHEAAYAGEDVDADTYTGDFPQSVEDSRSSVPNMQSVDTELEDVRVRRSSLSTQSDCVAVKEDMRPIPDVAELDSSSPYMRIGNTSCSPQPSEDTNAVLDNVSINSFNDSFPLLHLGEIPRLDAAMWQNMPLQEMMVFRTGQILELAAPKEREDRQAAQQTASTGTDKRQSAEQSTSKGEGNSQTTDYVRYCLDGDDNCQTELCRPSSGSVVPHDISLSSKCQPLPNGRSQDQNTEYSGIEKTEVKHNSIHSTLPQGVFVSSEHQASHSKQGQNATYPSAQDGSPSHIRTDRTVPRSSVQLSNFKPVAELSNQGLNVAVSNVPENCVSSCCGDYIRQGDGHKIGHLSEGCGGYIGHTDGQKLNTSASNSFDDYARQYDTNTEDVEKHDVRANHMCLREETYPPENSSFVSFGNDLPVNSSSCSLAENDFSIKAILNNIQASFPGSQNDYYDDEDWCYMHSDEEVSGEAAVDMREPRASSVGSSGYMPLPSNTYSGSDGSDVSYNGYI